MSQTFQYTYFKRLYVYDSAAPHAASSIILHLISCPKSARFWTHRIIQQCLNIKRNTAHIAWPLSTSCISTLSEFPLEPVNGYSRKRRRSVHNVFKKSHTYKMYVQHIGKVLLPRNGGALQSIAFPGPASLRSFVWSTFMVGVWSSSVNLSRSETSVLMWFKFWRQ